MHMYKIIVLASNVASWDEPVIEVIYTVDLFQRLQEV